MSVVPSGMQGVELVDAMTNSSAGTLTKQTVEDNLLSEWSAADYPDR